jgi:hypothetical protein
MNIHVCKTEDKRAEFDARGIFLCYVCDTCYERKMAKYRAEVLIDPNYWRYEPIDEEAEFEEAYYSGAIFPTKLLRDDDE